MIKRPKTHTGRKKKRKSSPQIVLRKLDDHSRRMKLDPFLSPCMKTLSASKTKSEIPNSETTRKKHRQCFLGVGKNFLNRAPFSSRNKTSIVKWDFTKVKSLRTAKETVRWRGRPQNGREFSPAVHLTEV